MRRQARLALIVAVGIALAACGFEAVGSFVGAGPDAGEDGPSGEGAVGDASTDALEEGFEIIIDAQPSFDATLDVNPANCLAVCEAGTCNGGTCVIGCDGGPGSKCQGQPVVCPPGVPCEVQCTGTSTCDRGVDCSAASRCNVQCTGTTSCTSNEVVCTGDSCVVNCSGKSSCDRGVTCDAGSCILSCTGITSCTSNPVECFSDSCTVQCGVAGVMGQSACDRSVRCMAKDSCTVACLAITTCTSNPVVAVANEVSVVCSGNGTCDRGVNTTAGDSGILCQGTSACGGSGQGISCDGGHCQATCDAVGNPTRDCCKAASCAPPITKNGCTFTSAGCPP